MSSKYDSKSSEQAADRVERLAASGRRRRRRSPRPSRSRGVLVRRPSRGRRSAGPRWCRAGCRSRRGGAGRPAATSRQPTTPTSGAECARGCEPRRASRAARISTSLFRRTTSDAGPAPRRSRRCCRARSRGSPVADRPHPRVARPAARASRRSSRCRRRGPRRSSRSVCALERLEAAPGEVPAVPGEDDDRDGSREPLRGRSGFRKGDAHAASGRVQAARSAGSTSEATRSTESERPSRRGAAKASDSRSSRSASRRRRCSNGRSRARRSIRRRRSASGVSEPHSPGTSPAVSAGVLGPVHHAAPRAGAGPAPPSRRRSGGWRRGTRSRSARTARRWARSASSSGEVRVEPAPLFLEPAAQLPREAPARTRAPRSMRACGVGRPRVATGAGSGGAVGIAADYRERPPGGADGPPAGRRRPRCENIGSWSLGDRGSSVLRQMTKDSSRTDGPSR